jgi:hypothetical protein
LNDDRGVDVSYIGAMPFRLKELPTISLDRHEVSRESDMEKHRLILIDVAIFGLIALSAGLFGFSHAGSDVTMIGRSVCCVSTVLALLALTVKRPPSR